MWIELCSCWLFLNNVVAIINDKWGYSFILKKKINGDSLKNSTINFLINNLGCVKKVGKWVGFFEK